MIINIY